MRCVVCLANCEGSLCAECELESVDDGMRALDLFCGAGGVSVGLARAGFEVTGVDRDPKVERYWRRGMEPYGGEFVCADALEVPLDGYDLICASPPCQGYSALRHLCKGKTYPRLIDPVRARLDASGTPWVIENVPGAPLGRSGNLVTLCGTMFGLQTPDGRAELRRHRLFESSFSLPQPACRHGYTPESLSVCGTGMGPGNKGKEAAVRGRRAMSITGHAIEISPTNWTGVMNQVRETFTIGDARAAMGIPWMPMKYLSQAIPPAYAEWIGKVFLGWVPEGVQLPWWWKLKEVDLRQSTDLHFLKGIEDET